MPYNTDLEDLIENILPESNLEKKKMFGGICYLINGNMSFGIWMDYLIVRMAPALAAEKLYNEHVKAFDLTGRPMKGWIMVGRGSWDNNIRLAEWLDLGRSFALTLPKKIIKRRSIEDVYYRNQK